MRIAVIFFGLGRALQATVGSIQRNVFDKLTDANLEFYTIASLNMPKTINNRRSGESNIELDAAEAFRLGADFYALCKQDDSAINAYLDYAQRRRDVFDDNWASVRNLLHQLMSLHRAWSVSENVPGAPFDYYLFLRPDLIYLDAFNIAEWIECFCANSDQPNIAVPPWHSHLRGFNDRFAFADAAAARAYAQRIQCVQDYCQQSPLHSESFLAFALRQAGCKVWGLPVRAQRARADGRVVREDFQNSLLDLPILQTPKKALHDAEVSREQPLPPSILTNEHVKAFDNTKSEVTMSDRDRNSMQLPSPNASPITLKLIDINGFDRVSPLGGVNYLDFLANLHRGRKITRYLEIGTQRGMSLQHALGQAVAVDPHFLLDKAAWGARPGIKLFEMTSDDFFAAHDPRRLLGGDIELAFIDGMHLAEFVLRDFVNVEKYCAKDSVIVLHDAIPCNFEMTERDRRPNARKDKELAGAWTGDVWRVVPLLARERPDLVIQVLDCPPTGLVLVSHLNPNSQALAERLDELSRSLTEREPEADEFWSFIKSAKVTLSHPTERTA